MFGKQYFTVTQGSGRANFYLILSKSDNSFLFSCLSRLAFDAVVSPNSGESMAFATGGWGRIDGCDFKALTLLGIQQDIGQAVNSPQTAIITSS